MSLHLTKWLLLATILLLVVVLGFFLPPVSIILMTVPILLPPIKAAGFDLVWFGILMTIVMEMGLIHPPVGLNIFVIRNVAPDIPLRDVIFGVLPVRCADGDGDRPDLPRAGYRDMVSRCADGAAGALSARQGRLRRIARRDRGRVKWAPPRV